MRTGIRLFVNLSFCLSLIFVGLSSCSQEEPAPVQENLIEDIDMDGQLDSLKLIYEGDFVSNVHSTSGSVKVYQYKTGERIMRFENFDTDNGPDLNVYMSASTSLSGFTDLGDLKSTSGNFNYNLPESVNLDDQMFVIIWCVDFSVLFGNAELQKR